MYSPKHISNAKAKRLGCTGLGALETERIGAELENEDVQEDVFEKDKLQRVDGHVLEARRKMKR